MFKQLVAFLVAVGVGAPVEAGRPVTGPGVRFEVPDSCDRGRFETHADGTSVYSVQTRKPGLGRIAVTVSPRGDPEATLANEMVGAEANARTKYFRQTNVGTVKVNRSLGVQGLSKSEDNQLVARCITWTKHRQVVLTLELRERGKALSSPVWKAFLASLRTKEAPLTKPAEGKKNSE